MRKKREVFMAAPGASSMRLTEAFLIVLELASAAMSERNHPQPEDGAREREAISLIRALWRGTYWPGKRQGEMRLASGPKGASQNDSE